MQKRKAISFDDYYTNKTAFVVRIRSTRSLNRMLSLDLTVSSVWYYCSLAESSEVMPVSHMDSPTIDKADKWTSLTEIKIRCFCNENISHGSKATDSAKEGFERARARMRCGEAMQCLLSLWFRLMDDWLFLESAVEIHRWSSSSS